MKPHKTGLGPCVPFTELEKTAQEKFDGGMVLCSTPSPTSPTRRPTNYRRTAPWFDRIKAPIRAVNIGGLFVLERWILPTFTSWGDDSGIHDQHSFSAKCGELGTCDDLKV